MKMLKNPWIYRYLYAPFIKNRLHSQFSIGIYEGPTPFDLKPSPGIRNPVLRGESIRDELISFVADPFWITENNRHYVFFEALNALTQKGSIAYADSPDRKEWTYRRIVLEEPFHLSYPYVFKWEDSFYMIPESGKDHSVLLYRAETFPDKWVLVKKLLTGSSFADASLCRKGDLWWLFVSTKSSDVLNIYYAEDFRAEWRPHPLNPVITKNNHIARPGGRLFEYEGRLYRLAQDDAPYYGVQVFAFEIQELTPTSYAEKQIETPIVGPSGKGWNAAGMHTVDLLQDQDRWYAVVDGRSRRTRFDVW